MKFLLFWGIVFVFAVVAELATAQLVSIWFAVGAVGAFIAAVCDLGFTAQLAIFVLVSVFLLVITRPLMQKLRVKHIVPLNAEKDIGGKAVIIEEVNAALGTGRARINGVDWMAVAEDGSVLAVDTIVVVTRIDGAKLIVRQSAAELAGSRVS